MIKKDTLDKKLYVFKDDYKSIGFDSSLSRINPSFVPLDFGNKTILPKDVETSTKVEIY